MNKITLMCVFVAIAVILANQPLSAREPTKCSLKVSVTESTARKSQTKVGTSVDEIFRNYYSGDPRNDIGDPYFLFAKQVESDLLEAVRANFCADVSSDSPVFVDITFLKLEMATQSPYHAQISKRLATRKSAYADVEIEKPQRKIKATIIWNPRRMLRDQLILDGYNFDDTGPLPPFLYSEFGAFIHEYEDKVLTAPSRKERDLRVAEQRGTMPDDIYGLLVHSGFTTHMGFGNAVGRAIRRLLVASQSGHAAIVKLVIDRAFEDGVSPEVNSIRDINRSDIEDLYLSTRW